MLTVYILVKDVLLHNLSYNDIIDIQVWHTVHTPSLVCKNRDLQLFIRNPSQNDTENWEFALTNAKICSSFSKS